MRDKTGAEQMLSIIEAAISDDGEMMSDRREQREAGQRLIKACITGFREMAGLPAYVSTDEMEKALMGDEDGSERTSP